MKKAPSWFSRVCDLEEQGRFEEAEAYFLVHATPEQQANFAEFRRRLVQAVSGISPEAIAETEELMKRFRAVKNLPEDNEKRIIWEHFWQSNPARISRFDWRKRLPDPLAKKGRPRGSAKISDAVLQELDRRIVETDEAPTRAAKKIVGDIAGAKNRADYLVKKLRERGKKSG